MRRLGRYDARVRGRRRHRYPDVLDSHGRLCAIDNAALNATLGTASIVDLGSQPSNGAASTGVAGRAPARRSRRRCRTARSSTTTAATCTTSTASLATDLPTSGIVEYSPDRRHAADRLRHRRGRHAASPAARVAVNFNNAQVSAHQPAGRLHQRDLHDERDHEPRSARCSRPAASGRRPAAPARAASRSCGQFRRLPRRTRRIGHRPRLLLQHATGGVIEGVTAYRRCAGPGELLMQTRCTGRTRATLPAVRSARAPPRVSPVCPGPRQRLLITSW